MNSAIVRIRNVNFGPVSIQNTTMYFGKIENIEQSGLNTNPFAATDWGILSPFGM